MAKIPKNLTIEQEKARRDKQIEYCKAWKNANKEKISAMKKVWREKNKEKIISQKKDWAERNKGKIKLKNNKNIIELSPGYVADCLNMKVKHLTPELLELKRQQLKLYRATKELKKHLTEATE